MRILPVLDLLNGTVVRGVAGRRAEYRPVASRLVDSAEPLAVARALREQLGLSTLYVADLDAILHERPNREIHARLAAEGFELWIDAGLRTLDAARRLLESPATRAVVGLETWPGPDDLARLCRSVDAQRVIFSLDLQSGKSLGDGAAWGSTDPAEIASRAVAAGIQRMIVLDLAGVGVSAGVATLALCRRLRERFANLELITGGGVRDGDDLARLEEAGIAGALVASAFHDGRVTRRDLERLGRSSSECGTRSAE